MEHHAKTISTNSKATKKRTATSATSAVRSVRVLDEENKGCRGNWQRQTPVPAPFHVANAFLRLKFLPRLQEPELIEDCNKMEREYYDFLSLVAQKYGINPQDTTAIPFPYNISASLADVRQQLKERTADWKEVRLIYENNCTYFAKEERYNTGMTLYYIPVIPLYEILQNAKHENTGVLLLSVYAYLYQILGVPYYRNEDSYLYSTYETFEEWILEDGEDQIFDDLQYAKDIGDLMKNKICAENLDSFETRLISFKAKTDFDRKILKVATQFFDLYKKFPNTRVDRKYFPLRFREEQEYEDRYVMLDNYLSFCSSLKGNLFECICQFVNEDLQEYGEIDEPTRFLPFDNRTIVDNNFDFESAVFDSLDDLIAIWQNSTF
ncbi:hypothetical protein LZQ00_08290 [Sphingobacterium sp. SRCM116780]|uniref:hypothetical protein n=1 Tax=Sphingobacterium sp. SRCM116780 TaxID=2907623 RepID=UPI001F217B03|nr:hypothetical protein [Sphingobacterium sp. SRCM116780]UIR57806.1 hypothetical protein LZQ00_08290 [Sphingobacterium sp. SRCM116780]